MSMTRGRTLRAGFPSPLEVILPPEYEGSEELYPIHSVFAEDRRAFEDDRFWFQDAVHYAESFYPFDMASLDAHGYRVRSRQRSSVRGPHLARARDADPRRLYLPEPQLDHRRGHDHGTRRVIRTTQRLLLRALGTPRSALARQAGGGDRDLEALAVPGLHSHRRGPQRSERPAR